MTPYIQCYIGASRPSPGEPLPKKTAFVYAAWLFIMAVCSGCCSKPTGKMAAGPAILCSPANPWIVTDYAVAENKTYLITARAIEDDQGRAYSDKGVKATPEGSCGLMGKLMNRYARRGPYSFWNRARRETDKNPALRIQADRNGKRADFMSLMTVVVGANESREKVESELASRVLFVGHGTSFKPDRDGRLVFFVNDWPGDENNDRYGNNTGLLLIQVLELPDNHSPGGQVILGTVKGSPKDSATGKLTTSGEEAP